MSLLRNTFSTSLLLVVTAGFALGLAGCDDGPRSTQTGTVDWDPQFFSFAKVAVGETDESRVRLSNDGAGPAVLASFAPNFDPNVFNLFYYFCPEGNCPDNPDQIPAVFNGQNSFPRTLTIASGDVLVFVMEFRPADTTPPQGALSMQTNTRDENGDQVIVNIPIRGSASAAELVVVPNSVNFGRVAVGEEVIQTVSVNNIGSEAALINAMTVNGSSNFRLSVLTCDESPVGVDPVQDPSILNDPDCDGTPGLALNGSFEMDVIFRAEIERADNGELSIQSNAVNPDVRVDLIANSSSPCMRVSPEALEFGNGPIGRLSQRVLTVESCGSQPLEIQSIELIDNPQNVFEITEDSLRDIPGRLVGANFDVNPPVYPTKDVTVTFAPEAEQPYTGTILVTGNDPQNTEVEVPIRGRGAFNECPVPAVAIEEMTVRPLDVITLDGTPSTDDGPGGQPASYEWVVVSRPEGSTAVPVERLANQLRPAEGGPADEPGTPTAVFFVDLAGTYEIELRVTDVGGLTAPSEACPEPVARVFINANPDEDIHIQLVWDTPGDDDQTDVSGSDVDLHFLHPRGNDWFRAGGGDYDCYFANPTPDWGLANRNEDNPSLDIDDTNGAGPENINLSNPENTQNIGSPYRVGVHYYRAETASFGGSGTYGASDVTIRIYLGGQLTYEKTRELAETNDFWEVAGVVWTAAERRVVEINQVSTRFPR